MRTIGRATQGVRGITLKNRDKLVSVARVVTDDSTQEQMTTESAAETAETEETGEPGETGKKPPTDEKGT